MEIGVLVIGFIFIFAVLCYLCYEGYKCYKIVTEDEKKKRITRGTWVGLEALVLSLLFLFTIIGLSKIHATSFEEGGIDAMKARFHEPIISEVELYGYEIVGTHIEKSTGSEKEVIEYSLDIRDILYKGQIFKKVKATQNLFKRVLIGDSFNELFAYQFIKPLKSQTLEPKLEPKKDSP